LPESKNKIKEIVEKKEVDTGELYTILYIYSLVSLTEWDVKMATTYQRLVFLLKSLDTDQNATAFLVASAWSQGSITLDEANKLCHTHGIADIMTYWKQSFDSIV